VVAVDEDAGHAVPLCTCCDGSAGDLVFVGYRQGPLVVLTEEHHGRAEDRGEVHRLVDITLGAGSVTEVGQRHPVVTPQALTDGPTDGMGHRTADHGADRTETGGPHVVQTAVPQGAVRGHVADHVHPVGQEIGRAHV